MNLTVEDIQKRALQYWYVDGISELGAGLVFVFVGLTYWLGSTIQLPYSIFFLGFGQPFLQVGVMVLVYWLFRWVKQKITYPRTGYLSYRRDVAHNSAQHRLLWMILAVIIAALVVIGLNFLIDNQIIQESWITVITAVLISGIILFINAKVHLIRLYVLSLYVIAVGISFSVTGLQSSHANPYFLMLVGAGWLVTGAVTLKRYLRETHPANFSESL